MTFEVDEGCGCRGKPIKEMNKKELDYWEYIIRASMSYTELTALDYLFYAAMECESETFNERVKLHNQDVE